MNNFKKVYENVVRFCEYVMKNAQPYVRKAAIRLHNTVLKINKRSVANIAVEIGILCTIYTLGYMIHTSKLVATQIFMENVLLIFVYFASYYFLPKREFDFKTLLLYLFSVTMIFPAILITHNTSEAVNIYEFTLLASCVFGLIFRSDFDNYKKVSAIIVSDGFINEDVMQKLEQQYKIVFIVCNDIFDEYSDKYLSFKNLDKAKRFMTFARLLPIFSYPTKIVYFPGSDLKKIENTCVFAQRFGLAIDNFDVMHLFDSANCDASIEMFAKKIVVVEYNGNPVMREFIKRLYKVESILLTITCSNEKLCEDIRQAENELEIMKIASLETALQDMDNIDYLFVSMPVTSDWHTIDNIRNMAVNNITHTSNILDICENKRIKFLYFISSYDSTTIHSLSGALQRLSELYIQHFSHTNSSELPYVIPVRFPKTLLDPLSVTSRILMNSEFKNTITIDDQALKLPIFNHIEVCDIFINLVSYISANRVKNYGTMYSILPENPIDIKSIANIISAMRSTTIHYVNSEVHSEKMSPINEYTSETKIKHVLKTDFPGGHQYDKSEIEDLKKATSIVDLTNILFSSLQKKIDEN